MSQVQTGNEASATASTVPTQLSSARSSSGTNNVAKNNGKVTAANNDDGGVASKTPTTTTTSTSDPQSPPQEQESLPSGSSDFQPNVPRLPRQGSASSLLKQRRRSRSASREKVIEGVPTTIHGGTNVLPQPSYPGATPPFYGGNSRRRAVTGLDSMFPSGSISNVGTYNNLTARQTGGGGGGHRRVSSSGYGAATSDLALLIPPPPPRQPNSVGHHRRVDSNGSVGSYGSVGGYGSVAVGAPPSPRPPPTSPRVSPRVAEFSARNEFFNVTGIRPPDSPRTSNAAGSWSVHPSSSSTMPGIPYRSSAAPPPPFLPLPSGPGAYSPRNQVGKTLPYLPIQQGELGLVTDLNGALSPNYGSGGGGGTMSLRGSLEGGEAVFLAQRRMKPESTRRRHMRHQSWQLYMEQIKGQPQPLMCRDLIFLILFVFHILGMVYLSNTYSYEALVPTEKKKSSESVTIYYNNMLVVACFSGAFAMTMSSMLLGVMMYFARRFVQVALCFIITLSFVWGTVGIGLSPKNIVPITGIIALALSVAYAIIVWDRIPFAAANLLTALSAVRAFPGTMVVALFFQICGIGWSIYFSVIVMGIYDSIQEGRIVLSQRMTVLAYIALGISFYWTYQVFLNVVQVATAAVIGSWWYQPDGNNTVKQSSFKTIFYSMGSVCFGSLFVGPVKVIRQVAVLFRPSSDEASLLCLHECLQCFRTGITSCVDELATRFNPWAFTYVGLYSYGFWEAGKLATELFDKRGWSTIVSDDLVPNILLMTSLVVGGITGCFGYILAGMEDLRITSADEHGLISFVIGIVIGLVATSILFGAISSSVNAVIVCFATSPVDFAENHPELNHGMRAAWREVWPGALDVVDMHVAIAQTQGKGSGGGNNRTFNDSDMSPLIL